MKITIETIQKGTFKKFGQLISLSISEAPTIATDTVTFWKQQAVASFGGTIEIGVLKVKKQEMVFDELENHFNTPTGLICLDADFVVAVGTPSDEIPEAESLKAFRIPQNELVILESKCWHSASYPIDKEDITLLVFLQKDALDNDTFYEKLHKRCELTF